MKRAWLWQILGPLAGVVLVLAGVVVLGQWTREWLRQQSPAQVPFTAIECAAPPGQTREDFLSEVQYLASPPEQLSLVDDELETRLRETFERHPWVQTVDAVRALPPGRVQVRLTFRTPVLAVLHNGQTRAVDGGGVVLPVAANCSGLPRLTLPSTAIGAALSGTVWKDPSVEAVARTAAVLRPHQDQLRLEVIEVSGEEVVLSTLPSVRVLWGRPPGAEKEGEATAAQKMERLLEYVRRHGSLGGSSPLEHDVRPRSDASHRPVPSSP
jgi:hypothetical protein